MMAKARDEQDEKWVLCPRCSSKTRTRIRGDTVVTNFPLFCPKCKAEYLISVKDNVVSIEYEIKPDA